jgi:hypothetical protein
MISTMAACAVASAASIVSNASIGENSETIQ